MNDKLNGRKVFVWRGHDLTEDTKALTAAVAEAGAVKLFKLDGALVWLKDGKLVDVARLTLLEIITASIAGVRLVNRGVAGKPVWETEYFSYGFPPNADTSKEPDDKVLAGIADNLPLLVARGPRTPIALSEQLLFEIKQRLEMGEPAHVVGDYYKIDEQLETIRRMAKAG